MSLLATEAFMLLSLEKYFTQAADGRYNFRRSWRYNQSDAEFGKPLMLVCLNVIKKPLIVKTMNS